MNVVEKIDDDYIYLLYVLDKDFNDVVNHDNIFKEIPELKLDDNFETLTLFKEECRGFCIENLDKRYVWFVDNYKSKRKSYGNDKYLGLRLIEVMTDTNKCKEYLEKYPNHEKYIQDIENSKMMFCRKAHMTYKRRYIQKQFVVVAPELHYFIKNVYQDYLKNKKPIYLDNMVEYFNNYSKYSKFVFLKSHLSIIHPKLTGTGVYSYKKKNVDKKVVEMKSNEYESDFPPLNN